MKSALTIVGAIFIVVVIGVIAWLQFGQPAEAPSQQPPGNSSANGQNTDPNNEQQSQVQSGEVAVSISNSAFSPSQITVRKGTTITWTNQDNIDHNVVAVQPNNTGGLPTQHALLSRGDTFSHTFDTAGTFEYTCQPHSFMRGTVEVVE